MNTGTLIQLEKKKKKRLRRILETETITETKLVNDFLETPKES